MAPSTRTPLWPAARPVFISALFLFVITIVIGILNGLDVYTPDHDTLITHVHAGTLGWITLAVGGAALLMFTADRLVPAEELKSATNLSKALIGSIALYVAAFLAGDRIPGDRIQRPIAGTLLFLVVIWLVVWLVRANRAYPSSSVARLGMLLAWVGMLIGATFGVVLGIYTARNSVPGLADDAAARVAEAHPPAMVIGFLFLAAFCIVEWLLHDEKTWAVSRLGATMMWLAFAGGVLVNVAFVIDQEALLGPANLLAIVGVGILIGRARRALAPSAWRGAGSGVFPRLAIVFLVVYLVLLTVIVQRFVSGAMDINALQDWEFGLILTFDHVMFLGVMTFLLFGVVSTALGGSADGNVDRIVAWGVGLGLVGFAAGLLTVTPVLKRISTPVLGVSLLIGIWTYVSRLRAAGTLAGSSEAAGRL